MTMVIPYNTRDAEGNDIIKEIEIKEFPLFDIAFICPICGEMKWHGVRIKDAVSANFIDWTYVGDYICKECSKLLSLYHYCYEVSPNGIKLFNVREARNSILADHVTPFRIIVTKSRKKHLFYKSVLNYNTEKFAINLEEESIMTSRHRMKKLFEFVECLITIGQSKRQMEDGELSFATIQKVGFEPLHMLRNELSHSREIQIPIFCGQPRDISEEEAIRCITGLTQIQ